MLVVLKYAVLNDGVLPTYHGLDRDPGYGSKDAKYFGHLPSPSIIQGGLNVHKPCEMLVANRTWVQGASASGPSAPSCQHEVCCDGDDAVQTDPVYSHWRMSKEAALTDHAT
ncbi:MAG: hypothetical protein NVS9B15_14060 [Acidobacteriaceae bacterium]